MCELMKSSSNALDPILGFIQYLEHLRFLEYLLGVARERGRNGDGRISMVQNIFRQLVKVFGRFLL